MKCMLKVIKNQLGCIKLIKIDNHEVQFDHSKKKISFKEYSLTADAVINAVKAVRGPPETS